MAIRSSSAKPGAALLCAAAFCSCTVPEQGVVNFFALKKIIYGALCEAAHICALYVGQMRVHFFMKTKLDSISFLQPGRESREIRMLAP